MWAVSSEKGAFERAKNAHSDHPAHAQSIIRAFALHSYILKYPMILLADSEGPDQTARMRRLIWAFAVRIRSYIRRHVSHGAARIKTHFFLFHWNLLYFVKLWMGFCTPFNP